ncbi:hypothetical protein [Thalassoglobus polymorphus]|uniref:Uncharacterized protein n=1 Tax=Thalassoglobus polymorphus TaxID=2527994 RepID=A0A517QHC6_9PLAN|nr:hypothetical protein [Thalassoglobus polymorphus]QDT31028.1 hypothetical protein Mal48_02580 [Thalassoglobus polymorphus]
MTTSPGTGIAGTVLLETRRFHDPGKQIAAEPATESGAAFSENHSARRRILT